MTKNERINKLLKEIGYKAPEIWWEVFDKFYDDVQNDVLEALESYLFDIFNSPRQIKRCVDKIKESLC